MRCLMSAKNAKPNKLNKMLLAYNMSKELLNKPVKNIFYYEHPDKKHLVVCLLECEGADRPIAFAIDISYDANNIIEEFLKRIR